MARSKIVLTLILLLASGLLFRIEPYLHIYNVEAGDSAPTFELSSDSGQGLSLSDYEGKWVLVNFWATWCKPCVDEMPALNRLHEGLKDRGFAVLGISIDENPEFYQTFLDQAKIVFPTARDPDRGVMIRYGTSKVPESYLVRPDGVVARKYVNWQDWDSPEIRNYLTSLL